MRLTVIVPDGCVYIDGECRKVATLPSELVGIHAIQWYDDHGEVEYADSHKPNKPFKGKALIQKLADLWDSGKEFHGL